MPEGETPFNNLTEHSKQAEKEKDIIEVVCSRCGKHLEFKEGKGTSGISHSLCRKCADIILQETDMALGNTEIIQKK